jgi:predicted AAA+ superfamily ATPase
MIERIDYLEKLEKLQDKQIIKVITGVRRCGKSTLLGQFRDRLLTQGVAEEQIISINFEDLQYEDLLDYKALYSYITKLIIPDKRMYIFLDEIQLVTDFEKVADSLFIKPNVDLYITGSNALILSGSLATLLSGRYIEISILPLSFAEYNQVGNSGSRQKFGQFLSTGGLPYTIYIDDEQILNEYLEGIFNSVVLKDVIIRNNIHDVVLLGKVIKFMVENIGNIISPKKIADSLVSAGTKTTSATIEHYLKALTDSFIFYKADRFDIKGKEHFKTLCKYYIVDLGLRRCVLGKKDADFGRMLENVVYLELIRRGNKVSIGKMQDSEIDFVAINYNTQSYYQVSETTISPETLQRELKPLQKINDHYSKILLTMDESEFDYNGIEKLNIIDWLLNK